MRRSGHRARTALRPHQPGITSRQVPEQSPRVWIFDLDDTLHNASAQIFPHINRAMTQYLMTHLHVDEQEANRLRGHYWMKYGATLHGLMRHHGTHPQHFLEHTHPLADLHAMVQQVNGLDGLLRQLRGRKVVFTNAPMNYALRVLDRLGIRQHFELVFSIESTRFQPKPARAGFLRLLSKIKVPAARCVMVEDSLSALKTAKQLGMKTVYITHATRRPSFVDVRLNSVLALRNMTAIV